MERKTYRVEIKMVGDFYVEARTAKVAQALAEVRVKQGYQPVASEIKSIKVKEVQ